VIRLRTTGGGVIRLRTSGGGVIRLRANGCGSALPLRSAPRYRPTKTATSPTAPTCGAARRLRRARGALREAAA
jgi:hypothetical protein